MFPFDKEDFANKNFKICSGGCHKNEYLDCIVHSPSCVRKYKEVLDNFELEDPPDKTAGLHGWTVCVYDYYHHKLFNNGVCFCKKSMMRIISEFDKYNSIKEDLNKEICEYYK